MRWLINRKRLIVAIALLLLIVGFSYLNHQRLVTPNAIFLFLKSYPVLSPILFVALYVGMSVALVPTLPMNLGGGFLWGPLLGTCFSVIGATSGAIVAFMISRYLSGDYFNKRFKYQGWVWLRDEIEHYGWKAVAFTRINPIFSFGPLNYFFGITSIPILTYIWATLVFLIPPSALFATLGYSIGDVTLNGTTSALIQNCLILSALVTILTFIKLLINRKVKGDWKSANGKTSNIFSKKGN